MTLLTDMIQPVISCATCMGDANSPVMKGATFAILLMLGVLVIVLGSFLTFIRYLARKQREAVLIAENRSHEL